MWCIEQITSNYFQWPLRSIATGYEEITKLRLNAQKNTWSNSLIHIICGFLSNPQPNLYLNPCQKSSITSTHAKNPQYHTQYNL